MLEWDEKCSWYVGYIADTTNAHARRSHEHEMELKSVRLSANICGKERKVLQMVYIVAQDESFTGCGGGEGREREISP